MKSTSMDQPRNELPQPMSWDEYKRLGPHSGPLRLAEVGIGVVAGLCVGAGLACAFPPAALWLTIGGGVVGGAAGSVPSIYRNQAAAYDKYLGRFQEVSKRPESLAEDGERIAPVRKGAYVARVQEEHKQATFAPGR